MATRKKNLNKYIPVGLALAIGGALLYWSRRASADTSMLPPSGGGDGGGGETPSGGGGGSPSGGGGGSSTPAPPFPGERRGPESGFIEGKYAEWLFALGAAMDNAGNPGPASMENMRAAKSTLGIPSGRTPGSWYADAGLQYVYGVSKILGEGASWQPYIAAWNRMYNDFRSRPLDPTA
jgi:hypothetical protein